MTLLTMMCIVDDVQLLLCLFHDLIQVMDFQTKNIIKACLLCVQLLDTHSR